MMVLGLAGKLIAPSKTIRLMLGKVVYRTLRRQPLQFTLHMKLV